MHDTYCNRPWSGESRTCKRMRMPLCLCKWVPVFSTYIHIYKWAECVLNARAGLAVQIAEPEFSDSISACNLSNRLHSFSLYRGVFFFPWLPIGQKTCEKSGNLLINFCTPTTPAHPCLAWMLWTMMKTAVRVPVCSGCTSTPANYWES